MFTSFIATAARQHDLKLSPQNSSALKHTHLKWHILWGKRVSVHHLSGSSAHKILGNWYLSLDLTTKHMFLCQYFFPSTNDFWAPLSAYKASALSWTSNQVKNGTLSPSHIYDFNGCPSPLFHFCERELWEIWNDHEHVGQKRCSGKEAHEHALSTHVTQHRWSSYFY